MNTETQITTEQFLEDLYRDAKASIYFNINGKSWKDKPQTYSEAQPKLEYLNNIKKYDIYFIPNSGGTKNSHITHINSSFIDWDAGKDSYGNYLPIHIVEQKKQEFHQQLSLFPYKPTYIIETRNGYHVYWFLYTGTTIEQFVSIQKELIKNFNSDTKIYNPARVMRLPGYYASKSDKYSPFLVNIIEHNNVKYSVDTFISHFNSLSDKKTDSHSQIEHTLLPSSEVRISAHNNIDINKVYTRSIIMGTYHQSNQKEKIRFNTMKEVVDYLCRQNIGKYLDLINTDISSENGLTVECPFHNDKLPSASIYYYEDYCYLKCHSQNCSFGTGTLVKVVEMKDNITKGQAVIKLMEYYNIGIDDNNWKKEEDSKYVNNIKTISQCGEWKERYPDLYRCINRIKEDLLSKLLFAKTHIQLRTSEGKSLFYCSLREFERIYKQKFYLKGQNRQNERVDRYCLLGLMEKINGSEIPYGIYRNMQEVKGKKRFKYRVQCYSIPEYTPDLLHKADETARIAKDKGIKLNSITKNSVRDVFGDNVARRLYPQTEEIEPSDSGMKFLTSVEKVLLEEISVKGYTTTAVVKKRLQGLTTWKRVHDRRVKEYLPGIFEKHKLVEITANKLLKGKYEIDSKGYPKIIILKQDKNSVEKSPDASSLKEIIAA